MLPDHEYRNNAPTSTKLSAALAYADNGIPVFPCETGGKRPLTRRGYLDATTDADQLRRWWRQWPDANIGTPTGKRSGLLVIDEDRAGAIEELEAKHGKLPKSTTVRTGSGGIHLYLKYPAGEEVRNSAGKLIPGLDIRGEGGYVVAPGSVTEGAYEVIEDAPLADAPALLVEALRRPHSAASREPRAAAPAVILDGEPIPDGQRNETMFKLAASLRGRGLDAGAMLAELERINAARCSPPLDGPELAKIANSAARYAPGTGSPGPDDAAREMLREIEAEMMGRVWRGMGGKSARDVVVALIKLARKHGTLIPAGVRVAVSIRALALAAGLSKRATDKAVRRLRAEGVLRRDGSGERGKSGAFVLSDPRAEVAHSTIGLGSEESGLPLRAPRLRWSTSEIRRLGKGCGQLLDILEAAGGTTTVEELAEAMGCKRPRELTRRRVGERGRDGYVTRLAASAVVECSGDTVALTVDWLDALDLERENAGEIAAYRRDMRKYDEQRTEYRVRLLAKRGDEPERIADQLGLSIERVRQILQPAEPVPEPEPVRDVSQLIEAPAVVECSSPKPDNPELLIALNRFLYLHPNRRDESPNWLAVALWGDGYIPTKPTAAEIAALLPMIEWAA